MLCKTLWQNKSKSSHAKTLWRVCPGMLCYWQHISIRRFRDKRGVCFKYLKEIWRSGDWSRHFCYFFFPPSPLLMEGLLLHTFSPLRTPKHTWWVGPIRASLERKPTSSKKKMLQFPKREPKILTKTIIILEKKNKKLSFDSAHRWKLRPADVVLWWVANWHLERTIRVCRAWLIGFPRHRYRCLLKQKPTTLGGYVQINILPEMEANRTTTTTSLHVNIVQWRKTAIFPVSLSSLVHVRPSPLFSSV